MRTTFPKPVSYTHLVTCLGYLPQKVTVPSSRNSITIYLQEDAIMLDATVVIGYGTQKKVNLTGAVATVGLSLIHI